MVYFFVNSIFCGVWGTCVNNLGLPHCVLVPGIAPPLRLHDCAPKNSSADACGRLCRRARLVAAHLRPVPLSARRSPLPALLLLCLPCFRRRLRPPRPPPPQLLLKLFRPPKIQAVQVQIRTSTIHKDAALAQLEKAAVAQRQGAIPPAVRRFVEGFAGICGQNLCVDKERQEPREWVQEGDTEGGVLFYCCEA